MHLSGTLEAPVTLLVLKGLWLANFAKWRREMKRRSFLQLTGSVAIIAYVPLFSCKSDEVKDTDADSDADTDADSTPWRRSL
jgi:hypothetical protein